MTNRIETSVLGREDSRLNKWMSFSTVAYLIVFLTGLYFLVSFSLNNMNKINFPVEILPIPYIFFGFVIFFPFTNFVERKITGKDKNTKYVIRTVTTDIDKEFLCVFKESFDGRFSCYSKLQIKRKGMEGCIEEKFFPKHDPSQAFEFKRQLEEQDEKAAFINQEIVTIHPKA
jgi:hypothetical protein